MLDATSHLNCSDPRDKVFAILDTISSGHKDIEADYTITTSRLINKVLENMHGIEKPEAICIVEKQCSSLAERFGVDVTSIHGANIVWEFSMPYRSLWCDIAPTNSANDEPEDLESLPRNMYRWCKDYCHQAIGALVRRELAIALEPMQRHLGSMKARIRKPNLFRQNALELQEMVWLFDEFCS